MIGTWEGTLDGLVEAASAWLTGRPWIERCLVHVRTQLTGPGRSVPVVEGGPTAAIELWTSREPMDWGPEVAAGPLQDASSYEVEEIIEKDAPPRPSGRMGGITLIALLWPAPGLSMSEVRVRYARHGPLARRVHIGMAYYSRNLTERTHTPGSTPWFGASILWYPTEADYTERHYESPEGAGAIAYDIRGFLDAPRSVSFYSRSHAVR